jgi:transcriptional regulator GlxA family with amidase domain
MNTKLNHLQNWPELAQKTKWSVTALAKLCGVSVRTLERHFLIEIGKTPKAWLIDQRQKQAGELLFDGKTIKEISGQLGYKHATNFSRKFKNDWGVCPSGQTVQTPQK